MPDVVLASILDARHPVDAAGERGDDAASPSVRAERAGRDTRTSSTTLVAEAAAAVRPARRERTADLPVAGRHRSSSRARSATRLLAAGGRIGEREHVFDASIDELRALLRGTGVPTDRRTARPLHAAHVAAADLTPKTVLGRPPAPPPVDVLPGRMPEMMRGVLMVTDLLDGDMAMIGQGGGGAGELVGTGIGTASYQGTARVVASADEALDRAEPGDIIVTRLTVPTFNSVLAHGRGSGDRVRRPALPHRGDRPRTRHSGGGRGRRARSAAIPDGGQIEIDPVAGRVTILS